ncbi:MAG: hypothetical protein L0Y74_06790 [candidate division Zixibacteria bacterium]|nr:hypothetical protein [candidate division Zixibacteria bacterium]
MPGIKIAVWFLISLLVLRATLYLWQRACVGRTGKKFQFLLTRFKFDEEISWLDVRYSLLVVFDSAVLVLFLLWVTGKLF